MTLLLKKLHVKRFFNLRHWCSNPPTKFNSEKVSNYPMSKAEGVNAEVIATKDLSTSVKSLTLHVSDPSFHFEAGQWVDFQAPGIDKVAGYSICSSPEHLKSFRQLQLAVKRSTFPPTQWVHTQCKEGINVGISIGGEITFDINRHLLTINNNNNNENITDKNNNLNVLLVAGGVGINPIISIYRHVAHYCKNNKNNNLNNKNHNNNLNNNNNLNIINSHINNSTSTKNNTGADNNCFNDGCDVVAADNDPRLTMNKKIHLIYSASSVDELIFKKEIERLACIKEGFSVEFIVTGGECGSQDTHSSAVTITNRKRLDEVSLKKRIIDKFGDVFSLIAYVCGPYNMIDDVSDMLRNTGLKDANIRYEKWW